MPVPDGRMKTARVMDLRDSDNHGRGHLHGMQSMWMTEGTSPTLPDYVKPSTCLARDGEQQGRGVSETTKFELLAYVVGGETPGQN